MKKIKGIKVRKAKLEDSKTLLDMAYQFYLESMEGDEQDFNSADVTQHIIDYLYGEKSCIFLAENGEGPVGMVAVISVPAYYNHKISVISDHHFWVDPKYRNSSVVKCLVQAIKNFAKVYNSIWFRAKIVEKWRYKVQKFGIKRVNNGH